jgi:aminobenzoyl-glutamate utilization protein A
MTCEARASDDEVVDELVDRIRAITEGAALAQGVRVSIAVMGQSATVAPDDEMIDRIVEVSTTHPDVTEVVRTRAFAGSDDANLLIRHVQRRGGKGAYLMVGAGSPGPHHSETFDVAEEAIPIAIDILESLVRG